MLYNVNRGSKNPSKTGRQLIPLSIDKADGEHREPLTAAEHTEALKKIKRFFKK